MNTVAVYNKMRILLRFDYSFAECEIMAQVMGLNSPSHVTDAQIAWVALKSGVAREFITDGALITSLEEVDENEKDWVRSEVEAEFPEIKEFETNFKVGYALYRRNGKMAKRREDIETAREQYNRIVLDAAKEYLQSSGKLK